jgi:hypothetical protein
VEKEAALHKALIGPNDTTVIEALRFLRSFETGLHWSETIQGDVAASLTNSNSQVRDCARSAIAEVASRVRFSKDLLAGLSHAITKSADLKEALENGRVLGVARVGPGDSSFPLSSLVTVLESSSPLHAAGAVRAADLLMMRWAMRARWTVVEYGGMDKEAAENTNAFQLKDLIASLPDSASERISSNENFTRADLLRDHAALATLKDSLCKLCNSEPLLAGEVQQALREWGMLNPEDRTRLFELVEAGTQQQGESAIETLKKSGPLSEAESDRLAKYVGMQSSSFIAAGIAQILGSNGQPTPTVTDVLQRLSTLPNNEQELQKRLEKHQIALGNGFVATQAKEALKLIEKRFPH